LKRAKEGEGPTLIEAITYRWYGHHAGAGADEQMGWIYRPEEEVEEWKKKDPVANFEKKLMAQGILTISRRESPPFQGWDERRAFSLRLLDIMQKTNICGIMIP